MRRPRNGEKYDLDYPVGTHQSVLEVIDTACRYLQLELFLFLRIILP